MAPGAANVLVVEDEKLLSWSLVKSLSKWGFDVHPVFTAHEAMEEIRKSGYDIVLLDYKLPDLNGLEVARRIRRTHPTSVILLVTAFQLSELPVDRGLIDGYFNKPLDLQMLHRTLKKICKDQVHDKS